MSKKNKNPKINTKEKNKNLKKENDEPIKTIPERSKLKVSKEQEKKGGQIGISEKEIEKNILIQKKKRNVSINKIVNTSTNVSTEQNNTTYQENRINQSTYNKKYYLNDLDKTIIKKDKNCIHYAYKNFTLPKNQITKSKALIEKNKAFNILSLEKKKIKKYIDTNKEYEKDIEDENIQNLIYDVFINKNLKIPTNKLLESTDEQKKKKLTKRDTSVEKTIRENKRNEKMKIFETQNYFDIYRKNMFKAVQNNLTAPEVYKEYAEGFTQVTPEERNKYEKEEHIEERRKKTENKKSVSTQIHFEYDNNLKCISKIIAKKILNEAFIQISYENNIKQLNEKKIHIQKTNETNKTLFKKLIDAQQNNLNVMKEHNKITSFLNIFSKINLFNTSRGIVDCLLKENAGIIREKKIHDRKEKIKWQNEAMKSLAKNTTALLRTEKMASFTAEELVEETTVKLCMYRNIQTNTFKDHINFIKKYFHEKNRINKGYISLLLDIGNSPRYVPMKVEEHMLLNDVLRKIKIFIKKELPLLKNEYDLNFLKIKNKENFVTSIKELCVSEPGELTICLNKKRNQKKILTKE